MARCSRCKHTKIVPLNCRWCSGQFCTSCVAVDIHACPQTDKKDHKDLCVLKSALPEIRAEKVAKI